MDYEKKIQLQALADKQIELCKEYGIARTESGKAKADLDILLVAKLPEIRAERPSIGYDMAILRLMEGNTVAQELYTTYKKQEARYKGLEKLAEAHGAKLIMEQSIMKREEIGEKRGY